MSEDLLDRLSEAARMYAMGTLTLGQLADVACMYAAALANECYGENGTHDASYYPD